MIENIVVAVLCILAVGAGVWAFVVDHMRSKKDALESEQTQPDE